MRFKRRTSMPEDPVRKRFGTVASLIDQAQRSLIAAVPTSRDPGIPLHDAIDAFLHALQAADAAMPGWRDERVAHEWTKCSEAIEEARTAAQRLKSLNVELTFEQLNGQIGDVLYPLESFVEAERSVRRR